MDREDSGVCKVCRHARWVHSKGGGELMLCRLSEADARFRRYPPLPVLSCPGWAASEGAA